MSPNKGGKTQWEMSTLQCSLSKRPLPFNVNCSNYSSVPKCSKSKWQSAEGVVKTSVRPFPYSQSLESSTFSKASSTRLRAFLFHGNQCPALLKAPCSVKKSDHHLVPWEKNQNPTNQPALTLTSQNILPSFTRTRIPVQPWHRKLRGAQLQEIDQGSGLGKMKKPPYKIE